MNEAKKRIIARLAILVVAVLLLAIGFVGNYLVSFAICRSSDAGSAVSNSLTVATDPRQKRSEEQGNANKKRLRAEGDMWDKATPSERKTILTADGLKLQGFIHRQPHAEHRWCISIHGYGCDHTYMNYLSQQYFLHGYNVLSPDLRASGSSQGKYIGMGWLERRDILQWIDTIVKHDPKAMIVLHGVSMGAATVMMVSGERLPPNVKACIEDCGYSSIWAQFVNKLHSMYGLPPFPLLHVANGIAKLRAGYYFSDGDCVTQLHRNKTPMLFIHGSADDYVPYTMLQAVYRADACTDKQMLVIPRARHAMACYNAPDTYWHTVWQFVDKRVK